jgi:hypothetical protein
MASARMLITSERPGGGPCSCSLAALAASAGGGAGTSATTALLLVGTRGLYATACGFQLMSSKVGFKQPASDSAIHRAERIPFA